MNEVDDAPTVCIAHGTFIPCRHSGVHRLTGNPYWVKAVRDYQGSSVGGLMWEPAWENDTPAPTVREGGDDVEGMLERHEPISAVSAQISCACDGKWRDREDYYAHVAEALEPLIAGRERAAGARGLLEAADALEGGLGVEGTPRNLYEFRVWLRDRAAALAPGSHDFDNHGPADNPDCPGCVAPETREDT